MRSAVFCLPTALLMLSACNEQDEGQTDAATLADAAIAVGGNDAASGGPQDAGILDGGITTTGGPCEPLGVAATPFHAGPYGRNRNDVAEDFTLTLYDGSSWRFQDHWTGCESFVFIPDSISNSTMDPTSIWARDLDGLINRSPKNAHYFFMATWAATPLPAMADRIQQTLNALPENERNHWRERLHLVAQPSTRTGAWIGDLARHSVGRNGFAIDRFQKIRGVGSLADVSRFNPQLQAAEQWPWEANMAYAANEVRYFNFEAERQARLDAVDATVIQVFNGEVLEEYEDFVADLPAAETMATFDTFEIDVTMHCPSASLIEAGNCGAWDYLAGLFVYDEQEPEKRIELARFITTYHREGRFVIDATPMLVHLKSGGSRRFRWSWAPSWNVQPTATDLALRLSRQNRADRPVDAQFLFSGGDFNADYNTSRQPIAVYIPEQVRRVSLFAIITGHGGATNNCAEFCDHQHRFTVNETVIQRDHPAVGNQEACMDAIDEGTVPNQWGSWWFGRGGWCPGQHVPNFEVDVTDLVVRGSTTTITYEGLFQGRAPPENSGNINMASYLIFYR